MVAVFMSRAPDNFVTPRLILRKPNLSDARGVFEQYAQDGEVVRYLAWRPHTHHSETEEFLAARISEWTVGSRYTWTITERDQGLIIGMYSMRWVPHFRVSLSYVLARAAWSKGYATELTQALVSWTLEQPEVYRVEACCDIDNKGSARVLEKSGMKREGLLARTGHAPNLGSEPRDCWSYAKTK